MKVCRYKYQYDDNIRIKYNIWYKVTEEKIQQYKI